MKVLRAQTGSADTGFVNAIDLKGLPLGEAPFAFRSDAPEAEAVIDLPVEIRNDVARLEIAGERSAGAVQLLDKRWRRRTVGIVSGSAADRSQPLIGATYYLARALNPFADIRLAEGVAPAEAVKRFLDQHLPMLILADVGNVTEARERLNKWIDNGGVLVRFAGPHLAGATDDDLVPVKLRRGGRILGGSLSWEKPQQLAAFAREGPFAGMPVPNDVTVTRQVLAEPDSQLTDRTWATLADGTPLVTAQRYGKGLLVLFHVTADTRWSDLPLSGTFVDMLRRIVALAGSTATADSDNAGEASAATGRANQAVPATRVLDGFGAFSPPPPTARPMPANFNGRANADHPPGFYGPPEGLVAVNTLAPSDRPAPLDFSPLNARLDVYRHGEPLDLRGPIFLAALALLMLDALVVILLSGGFASMLPRRRVAATLLAAGLLSALTMHHPAQAQSAQQQPPLRAGTRLRHEGDDANASRLHRHRRCRRRRREQSRPARPHAVPGATHRAGSRRADRARSGARRARLLPADLLAGVGERAEALADRARPHRHLHEARRHRSVRHPRRGRRAARPRRRDAGARHGGAALDPVLARHSRTSSRCRAITC